MPATPPGRSSRRRLPPWAAALAIVVVATAAFALVYVRRNAVHVAEHLNSEHSAYPTLHAAAQRGEAEVREALAHYLLSRPAPPTPPPVHLRYAGEGPDLLRFEDALPESVRDWQPGEHLPWSGGIPAPVLFQLQRQVFLFRIDWQAAEPEVFEKALAFVAEWRRANPDWPNRNPYAWNDDTTSNRLAAQIWLMEQARARGENDLASERAFVPSLLRQARHLVSEEEHNYQTNHGMMQNIALLMLSLYYPELDRDGQWRNLAVERMRRHLEEGVTPDGVFRELTPQYHWFAVVNTLWFVGACRQAGIELDPLFEDRLRGLLAFGTQILYPDKTLPAIADSTRRFAPRVLDWMWDLVPDWPEARELREALESDGCPNRPGARLWPEAGFFVLRSPAPDWTPQSAMMLTLKLHSESRAHAHHDALSLTLFGHGLPLIDGPGYPSYADRERRRRLVGTVSQNTVCVDGASQRIGRATITADDVRLEDGLPQFTAVGGRVSLYDGVDHERTVFFGPAAGSVLVVDRLTSDLEHRYALQFRPAPELSVELEPGRARLVGEDGSPALAIATRVVRKDGLEPPPAVLEDDMVRLVHSGDDTWFATVLEVGGDGSAPPVALESGSLVWRGERGEVRLRQGSAGDLEYEWTPIATP